MLWHKLSWSERYRVGIFHVDTDYTVICRSVCMAWSFWLKGGSLNFCVPGWIFIRNNNSRNSVTIQRPEQITPLWFFPAQRLQIWKWRQDQGDRVDVRTSPHTTCSYLQNPITRYNVSYRQRKPPHNSTQFNLLSTNPNWSWVWKSLTMEFFHNTKPISTLGPRDTSTQTKPHARPWGCVWNWN